MSESNQEFKIAESYLALRKAKLNLHITPLSLLLSSSFATFNHYVAVDIGIMAKTSYEKQGKLIEI